MSKQMPKLKDIAEEANVSISTASIILRNKKGRFNSKTQERVLSAANKLGWRKNLLVESIQTGKTRTIGVLASPYDSYWTGILTGIQNELASVDYVPIMLWVGDHDENMDRFKKDDRSFQLINRLMDRRVDGLILWPPVAVSYTQHFTELVERKVPVVVIDHELAERKITDSIETDEELGSRLAAEHFLKLGHKNIGCLTEVEYPNRPWAARRLEAFRAYLERYEGVKFNFWRLGRGCDDGREVAYKMLKENPDLTAVFCVTDHEAKDVYYAASELGLKIPEDISVVGFSNLDFAARMSPPLTTIAQKSVEVGAHAARLVVERVQGKIIGTAPHTIKVPCELIERNSTARCRNT